MTGWSNHGTPIMLDRVVQMSVAKRKIDEYVYVLKKTESDD